MTFPRMTLNMLAKWRHLAQYVFVCILSIVLYIYVYSVDTFVEFHYAYCSKLSVAMISIIMLDVLMLNVIILNVNS